MIMRKEGQILCCAAVMQGKLAHMIAVYVIDFSALTNGHDRSWYPIQRNATAQKVLGQNFDYR